MDDILDVPKLRMELHGYIHIRPIFGLDKESKGAWQIPFSLFPETADSRAIWEKRKEDFGRR